MTCSLWLHHQCIILEPESSHNGLEHRLNHWLAKRLLLTLWYIPCQIMVTALKSLKWVLKNNVMTCVWLVIVQAYHGDYCCYQCREYDHPLSYYGPFRIYNRGMVRFGRGHSFWWKIQRGLTMTNLREILTFDKNYYHLTRLKKGVVAQIALFYT